MDRRVYLSTVFPTHWKACDTVICITHDSLDKRTGEVVYLQHFRRVTMTILAVGKQ